KPTISFVSISANSNDALEEQCEDAVFKLCCTRERYSVRCANQLEKYLKLCTDKQVAKIKIAPAPNFERPVMTEEQKHLLYEYKVSSRNEIQKNSKNDVRLMLNRLKELKNIVKQIEQSSSSEIYQYLK
ncbi:PREDICTED: uncharacterized protein LOC105367633, partial [Ceratosolen solmsi marchali]|uniref:Uncharacterized protein LOC105367633 n=1 Tax=Ceratosolen solmsi marchali TaxID=326594 RepID=A0AAJ7E1S7_9HYME